MGIANAKGKYIAFLDDDVWMPEKIEEQMNTMRQGDESLALVYCQGWVKDDKEEVLKEYRPWPTVPLTMEDLLKRDRIGTTSGPLIKLSALIDVGCFTEGLPARQDYDCWLRLSEKYTIDGVDTPLFVHYLHKEDQITKDYNEAFCGYRYICENYADYYRQLPHADWYNLRMLIKNGIYARNFAVIRYIPRYIYGRIYEKLSIK